MAGKGNKVKPVIRTLASRAFTRGGQVPIPNDAWGAVAVDGAGVCRVRHLRTAIKLNRELQLRPH